MRDSMERNRKGAKYILLLAMAQCLAMPVSADTIKKSRSGICHDTYSDYYNRTKHYTSFDSLQECLESGGRLPKNYDGPGIKQVVANATLEAKADNRAFSTLYERSHWPHWSDHDRDCQDTRAELLIEQSETAVYFTNSKRCTVKIGRWTDPFSAQVFTKASDLDIDHVVPLAWAHGHGGQDWSTSRKEEFANDIDNLLVVDDGLNSQKGAQGPDDWLPPNHAYRCEYVANFDRIVEKYDLKYVSSEKRVIQEMLTRCR